MWHQPFREGFNCFAAHIPHPTLSFVAWLGDLVTIQELSVHILKICLVGPLAGVSWSIPGFVSTGLRPKYHPANREFQLRDGSAQELLINVVVTRTAWQAQGCLCSNMWDLS